MPDDHRGILSIKRLLYEQKHQQGMNRSLGYRRIGWVMACLLAPLWAIGQFTFQHYSLEDGLAQGSVDYMLKDSRRFLWLSVQGGLNRFDGAHFVFYRTGQRGLRGGFISGLVEAPNGDLWLGTEEGLNRYNRRTDNFTAFIPRVNGREQLAHTHVFYADDHEVWYISDRQGVVRFNYRTNVRTVVLADVRANMSLENPYIRLRPRQQQLWVLLPTGLLRYDLQTHRQRVYFAGDSAAGTHPQLPNAVHNRDNFSSLYIDESSGMVWLGGTSALIRFEPEREQIKAFRAAQVNFNTNVITYIQQDKLKRLWLSTDGGGLLVFDPVTERFVHHLTHRPLARQSIAMNQVEALYIDDEGIVWANVDPAGVDRIVPDEGAVRYYTADPSEANPLVANATRGFAEDNAGMIWIGTIDSGISRLDPRTGRVRLYAPNPAPGGLPTGGTGSVYCDQKGRVWIGTRQGLCLYNPQRDSFETILNPANPTPAAQNVRGLWEEPGRSSMLLATIGGLFRFWPDTRRFEALHFQNERLMGTFWYDAPRHRLYVGRWLMGFDCFDYRNGTLRWLYNESLGSKNALCFRYDARTDRLWIGSIELICFNPTTRRIEKRISPGYGATPIYSLLPDHQNQWWMGTNLGLYRFDPATRQAMPVREVRPQEHNSLAALRARNGELYFGGANGVIRIRPERVYSAARPLSVVLTDLSINGKPAQLPTYVGEADTVELPYTDNTLGLRFAAIDYHSLGNNAYRYRLVGYDRDWVESGTVNSARYVNLPPGTYRFEVSAADKAGRWTPEPRVLTVQIRPAFWQTHWFALVLGALLVGLGYLILQLYLQNRLRQQRHRYRLALDAQLLERQRIARDLHDNIGMDLVLLKMRMDILLEDRDNPLSPEETTRLHEYTDHLDRICTDVRDITHALVPSELRQQNLVSAIGHLVDRVQAAQPLLEINFTHEQIGKLPGSLTQPVYQIVKELLNNTIRHAKATLVDVELIRQNGHLMLTVADNGQGYDPTQLVDASGLGLHNIRTLVENLNGQFEVQPRFGRGVVHRVTVGVPNGE